MWCLAVAFVEVRADSCHSSGGTGSFLSGNGENMGFAQHTNLAAKQIYSDVGSVNQLVGQLVCPQNIKLSSVNMIYCTHAHK